MALGASAARGALYDIDWMEMQPWILNNVNGPQIPSPQTFNLPGVGAVQMSFTSPSVPMSAIRGNSASMIAASVASGPDAYSWDNHEDFRRTNYNTPGTIDNWSVTYTFLGGPVAAGRLALGVAGLGRLDLDYPGNITVVSVNQNGTFLGETVEAWLGPNQFSGGVGSFSLQNALPGDSTPGNPAFNTRLAVVRIDDTISSLTVNFAQIGNDGTGVNIGYITPEPTTASLLLLGGLAALRRRKR